MRTLSTGAPSTLGSYLELCEKIFGADSAPSKYFVKKIEESPRGAAEEVLADERQMLQVIAVLMLEDKVS